MSTMVAPHSALSQKNSEDAGASGTFPQPLGLFLFLSAVLTLCSFLYSIVCRRLDLGLPYSFPYYYVPGDMFSDFFGFHDKFRLWGTPAFFESKAAGYFMYPAPLAHVLRLLFAIPHPRSFFGALLLTVTGLLATAFYRILRGNQLPARESLLMVASSGLLSYPLIFELQRWNIEILLWLVSSVGVWSVLNGRTKTAAVFIGLAASLKFYPFIFLGLFLPRRRYLEFVLGVASFGVATLLALHGLGPTIAAAARWDSEQIAAFGKYFVGNLWALGYDHSFFALIKALTLHFHPDYFRWARPYSLAIAALSVILYFVRMWRLPLSNQILALSVLSVTMAPVSYDYTLLNLYPAFAMLAVIALQAEQKRIQVPGLTLYMVLFALILTPESYVNFRGERYGAQVRAVCLLIMLVLSLRRPLPEADFGPSPAL